jgi:Cu(I)/Ag(I) efflux system membrane fusion protein
MIRTLLIRSAIIGMLALLVILFVAFGPVRHGQQTATDEWTCSMHPQIRKNGPGQCPICGMDLVPVSQAAKEKERIETRAGVFVEPVTRRELFKEIRAVGKIDYNERQIAFITTRIAGWVDQVFADFTGIQVKKATHLAKIYSPDLYIGQSELIRAVEALAGAKKAGGDTSFADSTLESARTKLRLLGLLPRQIEEIEKSKKPQTHLTIYAPIGGTVIEKNVRQGQYVKEGDVLYRIANLDPVWLYLDLYEYDVGSVQVAQAVDVAVEALPGEKFTGKVVFIDPFLDEKTRTVRARVNLPNLERMLRPGMYASVVIRAPLMADGTVAPTGLEGKYLCPMHPEIVREKPGDCEICEMALEKVPQRKAATKKNGHEGHEMEVMPLAIPASAVLDTGRRKITYRQANEGAFELIELDLGPRADGTDDHGNKASYFVVKSGLKAGDRLVVRGGFLLDSQRQIEGMPSLLFPEGQKGGQLHSGHDMPTPKASKNAGHKH